MSLTEAEVVFASVHETALNDLITAFCTDRPRYLVYGSPSFVPVTTVAETAMPGIPFPGIPGGINWRIRLGVPRIDLFKQTDRDTHPIAELTCFKLQVFLSGHLQHVMASNGEDAIAFAVDQVEIVDIKPTDLESFLECLLFMILQAVLAEIRLPLRALRAGAFQLVPTVGPLIEDDQIKMRGTL